MKNLFVPYEIALALKEKGFYEPCLGAYINTCDEIDIEMGNFKEPILYISATYNSIEYKNSENIILAPLYQQVIDWFREKHKIQIEILWRGDMSTFCYKLGRFEYGSHTFSEQDWKFSEYYKALNKAIEEAIRT